MTPGCRLAIQCAPKHGSWINLAELELSAICGKCRFAQRVLDMTCRSHSCGCLTVRPTPIAL